MSDTHWLDYTVRRSARARSVNLRVTPAEGIVVVLPERFDAGQVPGIVDSQRAWLERKLAELGCSARLPAALPNSVELKAIGRRWPVVYQSTNARTVQARLHRDGELIIRGKTGSDAQCRAALRRWLARQGRQYLIPWLDELSGDTGLTYASVTIRGQRSRWGSCSNRQTISLNYQLLCLEPALVRCVLLHELCHARHLHHGPAFWSLLGELEPDYEALHRALRVAWRDLPGWLLQPRGSGFSFGRTGTRVD